MSRICAVLAAIGLALTACDKPNAPAPVWEDQWKAEVRWDAAGERFLLNDLPADTVRLWDFEAGATGGEAMNAQLRAAPGRGVELLGNAADPAFRLQLDPGVRGDQAQLAVVRLTRLKQAGAWDGALYYSTPKHGESARFMIPGPAEGPAVGEPVVLVYKVADLVAGRDDWLQSTIIGLRVDLEAGGGGDVIIHQVALLAEGG